MKRLEIAVVGAGLSGAYSALLLGRAGHQVTVFERRGDPRTAPVDEGRAINLGLSERTLGILARAGLEREVAAVAVPMKGRLIHERDGGLDFQPYGERGGGPAAAILTPKEPVHSVRRAALCGLLLDAADRLPEVSFRFGQAIRAVDVKAGQVRLAGEPGDAPGSVAAGSIAADLVVGADGVFSVVRRALLEATNGAESLEELEIGYRQLAIQPRGHGSRPLRGDVHHVWPRRGFVMTGLPNPDGTFTATLFGMRRSLEALASEGDVNSFFQKHFGDVLPHMPGLEQEYVGRPPNLLVTLCCSPWHGGKAVLIGDACHTFMPFSGQGANAALADCEALAACLEDHAPELDRAAALDRAPEPDHSAALDRALEAYEDRRKPEAEAIAHLSNVMTPLVLWLVDPLTSPAETP